MIAQNVASGLVVHPEVIQARLERELPFLLTESLLIAGVRAGGDRQDLHERIRDHAMAARERAQAGSGGDFLLRVEEDDQIPLSRERLHELADPQRLTGRAAEQVDAFLAGRVEPILRSADALEPVSLRV